MCLHVGNNLSHKQKFKMIKNSELVNLFNETLNLCGTLKFLIINLIYGNTSNYAQAGAIG